MKRFAVVEGDVVVNVIFWDGVDDTSPEAENHIPFRDLFGAAVLIELPDDAPVAPGWKHIDSDFLAPDPEPAPPMTAQQAEAERDRLMAYATIQIAPLQDATDMGDATEAERSRLLLWKKYRVAVSRTSTSPGWPGAVQWPQLPA
jgi:hypothetical protein